MKRFPLLVVFVLVYSASNAQRPKYYSVPEVKGYFTFYKNNTINKVYNDTLRATFNKYNDSLYQIIFYSRRKVIARCDCLYEGVEAKEYAWIKKGFSNGKAIKDSFYVRQLTLKDTGCLKLLPLEVVRRTR